jgi:hypothetical protein
MAQLEFLRESFLIFRAYVLILNSLPHGLGHGKWQLELELDSIGKAWRLAGLP